MKNKILSYCFKKLLTGAKLPLATLLLDKALLEMSLRLLCRVCMYLE